MYDQYVYDPEAEHVFDNEYEDIPFCDCRKGVQMTDRDNVLLSPWEAYDKYHRFPFEAILQVLLLILAISQAMTLASEFNAHDLSNQNTFRTLFLEDEYEDGLYSIDDILDAISDSVDIYYNLPNSSITRYAFYRTNTGDIMPMKMKIKTYKDLTGRFWNITSQAPFKYSDYSGDFHTYWQDFNLTQDDPLGPLQVFKDEGYPKENNAFYYIVQIKLECSYHTADFGTVSVLPVDWKIKIDFNMKSGGEAMAEIITEVHPLPADGALAQLEAALSFLLIAFGLINGGISLLEIRDRWIIFKSTRNAYKIFSKFATPFDAYPDWEMVPREVIVGFFSLWSISNLIATILILFSQILMWIILEGQSLDYSSYTVIMGISITILCCNAMRYLQYNKKFYMFVLIWQYSMGNICRFIVSVFPIYAAYVLFGVLNFSQYSLRFESVDATSVSLFSLLNGDDIHDTFNDLMDGMYPYPWVGRLYLYSFVLLSMTSILNVCIFIIEDAFHVAKHCANEQHESERAKRKAKEQYTMFQKAQKEGPLTPLRSPTGSPPTPRKTPLRGSQEDLPVGVDGGPTTGSTMSQSQRGSMMGPNGPSGLKRGNSGVVEQRSFDRYSLRPETPPLLSSAPFLNKSVRNSFNNSLNVPSSSGSSTSSPMRGVSPPPSNFSLNSSLGDSTPVSPSLLSSSPSSSPPYSSSNLQFRHLYPMGGEEWGCRHCTELPDKLSNAEETANKTVEEKLQIIFDNLEKWQTIAVGPNFPGIALENELEHRAREVSSREGGGMGSRDAYQQIGEGTTESDYDQEYQVDPIDEVEKEKKKKKDKEAREERQKEAERQDKEKREKKEKKKSMDGRKSKEGDVMKKFHRQMEEMLRRHERSFQRDCDELRAQLHATMAEMD